MRNNRKKATANIKLQQSSLTPSKKILQQRNTNIFENILTKTSFKNEFYNKKSFAIKFQKAQRNHCCIDIVNRKNFTSQQRKKKIDYLERDQLKWDMFPKYNQQNEIMIPQFTTQPVKFKQQLNLANSIQKSQKSIQLKNFLNTFKSKLKYLNQSQRPVTSNQKSLFRLQSEQKDKKYSNLFNQDIKSIHIKEYNRKRRNKTQYISKIKQQFMIQDI